MEPFTLGLLGVAAYTAWKLSKKKAVDLKVSAGVGYVAQVQTDQPYEIPMLKAALMSPPMYLVPFSIDPIQSTDPKRFTYQVSFAATKDVTLIENEHFKWLSVTPAPVTKQAVAQAIAAATTAPVAVVQAAQAVQAVQAAKTAGLGSYMGTEFGRWDGNFPRTAGGVRKNGGLPTSRY